jgi:OOP family OmpA-OmpF porin
MTLSQGRAQVVVQALVGQYGIDPSRLVAKGYGETKPVVPNSNPANMAKNRRVELRKL